MGDGNVWTIGAVVLFSIGFVLLGLGLFGRGPMARRLVSPQLTALSWAGGLLILGFILFDHFCVGCIDDFRLP